jgi:SnoaL-like protein
VFADDGAAVMTLIMRYSSAPRPGVRSTFVLQREDREWRIRHVHFSFDPNQ